MTKNSIQFSDSISDGIWKENTRNLSAENSSHWDNLTKADDL